jgi:methyl-accepting chemotaxis protein
MDDHEVLLKPMRIQVDKVMMVTLVFLFLVTVVVGLFYGQLGFSLMIGIPVLVSTFVIWRAMKGTLFSRLTIASALIIQIAIHIQVSHGVIEMHFGLFAVLAFLLAYRDWRPIIFGAVLIAVHHLVCNSLQALHLNVWIFNHGENYGIVLLHAAYVVFESIILVYLAIQLRTEGVESAKVAFMAERITQGDLSSGVEFNQKKGSSSMLESMLAMQESLSQLVTEIEIIVDAAVQGDFSKKIDLTSKSGFGEKICGLLNQLLETTEVGLNDVMRVTNALAAGDLSQKITHDYPGVFGQTKNGVNNTVDSLNKIIC